MEIKQQTKLGNYTISTNVVQQIVDFELEKEKGIKAYKKTYLNNFTVKANTISLELGIRIEKSKDIDLVCTNIQKNIKENIKNTLGFKTVNVVVNIMGFIEKGK